MHALCCICEEVVDAAYVAAADHVELVRVCPVHGQTASVVSHDVRGFAAALDMAQHGSPPLSRGLIIEMLDGCNVRCPTCIASSSPAKLGLRSASVVGQHLDAIPADEEPIAIFLSGGEPTIHPELPDFVGLVEQQSAQRRILITNGVRIAAEPAYLPHLATQMSKPWEVFLQFDSLRANVLSNIRWGDVRDVRQRALDALGAADIATTLVCVIKRELNLDEIDELLEFALAHPFVVGLQLQPIRAAGRLDNYDAARDACDLSLVSRSLASAGVESLAAHPSSPLAAATSVFNRDSAEWREGDRSYFVDKTAPPGDRLRVAVLEYSDSLNWSTLRAAWSPIDVLQLDGTRLSVDDHFVGRPASVRSGKSA